MRGVLQLNAYLRPSAGGQEDCHEYFLLPKINPLYVRQPDYSGRDGAPDLTAVRIYLHSQAVSLDAYYPTILPRYFRSCFKIVEQNCMPGCTEYYHCCLCELLLTRSISLENDEEICLRL